MARHWVVDFWVVHCASFGASANEISTCAMDRPKGKMAAACPRWYNAALTHAYKVNGKSEFADFELSENRRACFCQTSPGMHV